MNNDTIQGSYFGPANAEFWPAQDKKKSLIRRPKFFICRPKGICEAIILEIRHSQSDLRRPSKSKAKPLLYKLRRY